MRSPILVAMALAAIAATGCKGGEEDDTAPAFVPKTVVFEGKVDPKYAGHWTSTDGSSSLELNQDGSLKIGVTSASQSGKSTSSYDGHWLLSGSELRFQYTDGSKQQTTLAYSAILSGNSMTLQQSGGKMKTNYTRKSPQ